MDAGEELAPRISHAQHAEERQERYPRMSSKEPSDKIIYDLRRMWYDNSYEATTEERMKEVARAAVSYIPLCERTEAHLVESTFLGVEGSCAKIGDRYSDGSLRNVRWIKNDSGIGEK